MCVCLYQLPLTYVCLYHSQLHNAKKHLSVAVTSDDRAEALVALQTAYLCFNHSELAKQQLLRLGDLQITAGRHAEAGFCFAAAAELTANHTREQVLSFLFCCLFCVCVSFSSFLYRIVSNARVCDCVVHCDRQRCYVTQRHNTHAHASHCGPLRFCDAYRNNTNDLVILLPRPPQLNSSTHC